MRGLTEEEFLRGKERLRRAVQTARTETRTNCLDLLVPTLTIALMVSMAEAQGAIALAMLLDRWPEADVGDVDISLFGGGRRI